jgi:nucleotide-binding universal stress UspA family protein
MTSASHAMKQFLVHFDDSPAAVQRLQFARRLASAHSGMVAALYAVTPALLEMPLAVEAGAAAVAALREIDERRCATAKAAFETAIEQQSGVRAHWAQVTDDPVTAGFNEQALFADVVVLGQRAPSSSQVPGVPPDLVDSTVFGAGRPALVVPFIGPAATDAQNIAVAWKPTREAARALDAAVPLLQQAREVHVLQWGDDAGAGIRGSHLDLAGWFRDRGIDVNWHRERGSEPESVGELLLTRSFELGCDLLVMGCYGHSRAREFVFGGATRTVLRSMPVPVLMAH